MKVGFIGFGEVASTLSQGLLENNVEVMTCVEGRSSRTHKLAEEMAQKMGLKLVLTNKEMAEEVDFLISSVTPSIAENVAQEVADHVNGIFIDINNISPSSVRRTLAVIKNKKVVDASIIGSVKKGSNVQILASGDYASDFAILNDYGLNIKIAGSEIGHASAIKMLRSSYTKGVSAILWETMYSAYLMGIEEEVMDVIASTEGSHFKDSASSRLISSAFHSKRRCEEMKEVEQFLSENIDPLMACCTEEVFKRIYVKLGKIDKRPENYLDVFDLYKED